MTAPDVAKCFQLPVITSHQFAKELAIPMVHLFNISLSLGQVPTIWKHAIVTPIQKGNESNKVSCFRPISILSFPSKSTGENNQQKPSRLGNQRTIYTS
ncbi:hypothetical protein COOONC_12644 [Cooperia oncophora]